MHLKDLTEFQLSGKRVLLRADMNVPMKGGKITNTERIDRSLPTIKHILEEGGKIILLSHLGRPEETGKAQEEFSLKPIVSYLEGKLQRPIALTESLDSLRVLNGSFTVLENIRFFKGEKDNDSDLAKKLGSLCDIFVLDAFAASHREHASTTGVISFVNQACIGFLVREELEALEIIEKANSPILAILGGAKISSKLSLIKALANKVDSLLLGGGIANTCLGSKGLEIGRSLVEPSLYSEARNLVEKDNVLLPDKIVVAPNKEFAPREVGVETLNKEECIFYISPLYIDSIKKTFAEAKTIIWNGPMGFFEEDKFSLGTAAVAELISKSDAYSVIGGGDTIAAAAQAKVLDSISYVSTAGGAFLNYLEGKPLPALVAIEEKALES
ncbi:MAG: phosphoglycerate kinase [Gammaproteobacteria bacterium]|nr:MAG: phosphoglycerate kinase [Gammaproteobacteria bacterium]